MDWATFFVAFVAIVFIALAAVTLHVVFTRWVARTEVNSVLSKVHVDLAKLEVTIATAFRQKWNDDRIDRKFADIESWGNTHETSLKELTSLLIKDKKP